MTELATMNTQNIADALRRMAESWSQAGDDGRSEQAQELLSKLTDGRLTVALCGHFSAGKSSLVNALCGAKLLPSSPIPTSANIVSIRGGDRPYAAVETVRNGEVVQAEIPIEELDRYCVDGERFQSVSIIYPSPLLGQDIVLLDTPGIDSTDNAHRLATESALHLADVVFYVMDYNHVQSEINFAFAKSLKDWGKPLYFIVNQIDKHRDRELSFSDYARSVEEAFHAWHLEPAGILYLSLRQPDHPQHQWNSLITLIRELADSREELCAYSVYSSMRHLLQSHLKQRDEQMEPVRLALLDEAGGEEGLREVEAAIQRLFGLSVSLQNGKEEFRAGLLRELQSILDNANITPASLRDLAQAFLESRKPGFRAGLLFAGAKTAAEQSRRLEAFSSELLSLTDAAIDWHVRQLLRKAGEGIAFDIETLEAEMGSKLAWRPDEDWLAGKIKPGAVMGNEYTMIYCKEISADLKGRYRGLALEVIDILAQHAIKAADEKISAVRRELKEAEEQAGAARSLRQLEQEESRYKEGLQALLPPPAASPVLPLPRREATRLDVADSHMIAVGSQDTSWAAAHAGPSEGGVKQPVVSGASGHEVMQAGAKQDTSRDTEEGGSALGLQRDAAARLSAAAVLLEGQPALHTAAASMIEKAARLQSSTFTIALFGAFSAGKSSLANALIGEAVLPVSPNPTTAAINRLMPPDSDYEHGTARIVMKTRDELLADLRYSLHLLGEDASEAALPDASAIMALVDSLSPNTVGAGGRPHYSFLRAARAGWAKHEPLLGQVLKAERAEYVSFVAEESRSCFVSSIDFHYRCPLTDEGIVLVDTPGADSVNARHTGVAFNYIKNADAILFVTYYNHAFSQADRQFLDQLGRVKDQFELDKMFFIVNASDLASSTDELKGVLSHVESNLQKHGITFPRLYPVSSIMALDGKEGGDREALAQSGLPQFEEAFHSFVRHDLGQLAVQSAQGEIQRALQLIDGWIAGAEGDAASRQAELGKLERQLDTAKAVIQSFREGEFPQGLRQEMKELLYYVVQRLQFRLGDFYHLAFNPSSLQDDGRDLKRAVWTSWLELQRLFQRELSQELQATTLRLERGIWRELNKGYEKCCNALLEDMPDYVPPPGSEGSLQTPAEGSDWEEGAIQAKWLWSRFKSPRHFFEGEGKDGLRKELEALVVPSLQNKADSIGEEWLKHYEAVWQNAAAARSERLLKDVASFGQGKRQSLSDQSNLGALKELRNSLIHL
ncbi:dynamin family protein [Paenibacillus sp. CAU 1782]